MSEWKKIDGAPKDTPILVGAPGYRAALVRWSDDGGWHYVFTTRRLKAYPPTHWQHLPDPPVDA